MADKFEYFNRRAIELRMKKRPVCADCGRNESPAWALVGQGPFEWPRMRRDRALCRECFERSLYVPVEPECRECHEVFPGGHIAQCPQCGGRYLKPADK